jgi:hypothetical protein
MCLEGTRKDLTSTLKANNDWVFTASRKYVEVPRTCIAKMFPDIRWKHGASYYRTKYPVRQIKENILL